MALKARPRSHLEPVRGRGHNQRPVGSGHRVDSRRRIDKIRDTTIVKPPDLKCAQGAQLSRVSRVAFSGHTASTADRRWRGSERSPRLIAGDRPSKHSRFGNVDSHGYVSSAHPLNVRDMAV